MKTTAAWLQRYDRQLRLNEVGIEGQRRLTRARVLVIGAGGLGSPIAYYLAAAGIGCLGLVDEDVVSLSNLNRQILHSTGDLDMPKVDSAAAKLRRLNPEIEIHTYREKFTSTNAQDLVKSYDLVVDATDNLETRRLMNETCIRLGRPFFHGAVSGFFGQVMTVIPGRGPCWQCLVGDAVLESPSGGTPVLGCVAGVIGSLQAIQVVKYLVGAGDFKIGKVLMFDGLSLGLDELEVERDPYCPVCGEKLA